MQINMKYGCRKTIRDKTLHVWNSACGAAELCLTSRWSDRQGAKPEDGGTSLKHGFGDVEQEQLGCSLMRHLRSRISGGSRIPQVTFAIAHFTGGG